MIVPGPVVPAHADVETITVDGVGHLGMLISSAACRLHTRRLARTRVTRSGRAGISSVANGRGQVADGVLTEGGHRDVTSSSFGRPSSCSPIRPD